MSSPNELFHRFYSTPAAAIPESMAARRRLYAWATGSFNGNDLRNEISKHLGVRFHLRADGCYPDLREFFEEAPIPLVLSAATIIYRYSELPFARHAAQWLLAVREIFAQENLAYVANDQCVVRLKIDPRFESARASTISGLSAPKYSAIRHETEQAYAFLLQVPAMPKEGVRAVFEALESLCKQLLGGENFPRLTKMFVDGALLNYVTTKYQTDRVAQEVAVDLVKAFGHWVSALHMYRHGQETIEPVEVPFEVAVMILDQGSAYLRWLLSMDARPGDAP